VGVCQTHSSREQLSLSTYPPHQNKRPLPSSQRRDLLQTSPAPTARQPAAPATSPKQQQPAAANTKSQPQPAARKTAPGFVDWDKKLAAARLVSPAGGPVVPAAARLYHPAPAAKGGEAGKAEVGAAKDGDSKEGEEGDDKAGDGGKEDDKKDGGKEEEEEEEEDLGLPEFVDAIEASGLGGDDDE
jgi:hypothetical protein